MTARLNARVGEDLVRKVKYLQRRTGASATEVIVTSLEAYYERMTRGEQPALLLKDFIGCVEGQEDLSASYKSSLTNSLVSKHRVTSSLRNRG